MRGPVLLDSVHSANCTSTRLGCCCHLLHHLRVYLHRPNFVLRAEAGHARAWCQASRAWLLWCARAEDG